MPPPVAQAPRSPPADRTLISALTMEAPFARSEEHTSELQSQSNLVCRLLLEKKKNTLVTNIRIIIPGEIARAHHHYAAAHCLIFHCRSEITLGHRAGVRALPGNVRIIPKCA